MNESDKILNIKRVNLKSLYAFCSTSLKKYYFKLFLSSILFAMSFFLAGILSSHILEKLLDNLETPKLLLGIFILFALTNVFAEIVNVLARFVGFYTMPDIEKNIRLSAFDYIQKLSPMFFNKNNSGLIESTIDNLSEGSRECLEDVTAEIFPVLIFTIGSIIYLFFTDRKIGIILLFVVIIYIIIYYCFSKDIVRRGKIVYGIINIRTGTIIDCLYNIKLIQIMHLDKFIIDKIGEVSELEKKEIIYYFKKVAIMSFITSLWFLFSTIGIIAYLLFFSGNVVSPGCCVKIINILLSISTNLWVASRQIIDVALNISRMSESIEQLYLASENHIQEDNKIISLGNIEIKNLSIDYEGLNIINNFSCSISFGQKICIIGASGCGKSTLVNAISKSIPVDNGSIFFNNYDINELDSVTFKNSIGYITQNNCMFEDTILENIIVGRNYSLEQVISVCESLKIHEFIEKLPKGYYTHVGACSRSLSGGQIQKIAIARAILSHGNIIICDEPVSSLDPISSQNIIDSIFSIAENKTLIWIDHHGKIAKKSDKVLFFDSRKNIFIDTHANLLSNNSEYNLFFQT